MRKAIVALAIALVFAICTILPAVVSSGHQGGHQNGNEDYAMTPDDCTNCHSWVYRSPHHPDQEGCLDCLGCHTDLPDFTIHRDCLYCHDVQQEHHRLSHGPKDCSTCHGTQS